MPMLAWSAQAGGFFAGSTEEPSRVNRNDANHERLARAEQLGRRDVVLRPEEARWLNLEAAAP
jgi:hypothetical protein